MKQKVYTFNFYYQINDTFIEEEENAMCKFFYMKNVEELINLYITFVHL